MAVCLICGNTASVFKVSNLKHHFTSRNVGYCANFSLDKKERTVKELALNKSFTFQSRVQKAATQPRLQWHIKLPSTVKCFQTVCKTVHRTCNWSSLPRKQNSVCKYKLIRKDNCMTWKNEWWFNNTVKWYCSKIHVLLDYVWWELTYTSDTTQLIILIQGVTTNKFNIITEQLARTCMKGFQQLLNDTIYCRVS